VRRHADAEPARLVDERGQLLAGHLCRLGILALDRPRAGGDHLHEVGAAAELLAHRPADVPRPVRLPVHRAERRAARGRRRDDAPAGNHPWAFDEAPPDRLPQHDRLVAVGADVPHRRDAGPQERRGGVRKDEPAERARPRLLAVERGRRPESGAARDVARHVHVRIDHARHEGTAADVDRPEGGSPAAGWTDAMRPRSTRTHIASCAGPPRPSTNRAFQSAIPVAPIAVGRPVSASHARA
jgi:hypothetical protein